MASPLPWRHKMKREILGTHEKALEINLDRSKYGTFAEIGAGQEVARWTTGMTPGERPNLPLAIVLDNAGAVYVSGVGTDHYDDSNLQKFEVTSPN